MMLLEEEKKKKQKEERKDRPQKNNKRKYDDPYAELSKEDAENLGLNFRQGGPPKFKNDKKKLAVEEGPKETREVIEVNTAKNNEK